MLLTIQVRCKERLQLHTSGAITEILQEHQCAECHQRQCRLQDQLWIDVCIDSIWGVLSRAAATTSMFQLGGIHRGSGVSDRTPGVKTTINFHTSSFKISIRNARFIAKWHGSKTRLEVCTASWTAFWKKVGFHCSGSAVLTAGESALAPALPFRDAFLAICFRMFQHSNSAFDSSRVWNTLSL